MADNLESAHERVYGKGAGELGLLSVTRGQMIWVEITETEYLAALEILPSMQQYLTIPVSILSATLYWSRASSAYPL